MTNDKGRDVIPAFITDGLRLNSVACPATGDLRSAHRVVEGRILNAQHVTPDTVANDGIQ